MSDFIKRILELEAENTEQEGLLENYADTEVELRDRIKELEEIETDLNGSIGYFQMGVDTWKTRAEELEAELAYIEKHHYCHSCKGRCIFTGYESGLLVFVCIKCGSKLWHNASNETITLPEQKENSND